MHTHRCFGATGSSTITHDSSVAGFNGIDRFQVWKHFLIPLDQFQTPGFRILPIFEVTYTHKLVKSTGNPILETSKTNLDTGWSFTIGRAKLHGKETSLVSFLTQEQFGRIVAKLERWCECQKTTATFTKPLSQYFGFAEIGSRIDLSSCQILGYGRYNAKPKFKCRA